MSPTDSSPDLTSLVNLIVFGVVDPEAETPTGGVMGAVGLDVTHVVEEDDPGDRPSHPFMTFALQNPSSGVVYGPDHNPVSEVLEDPDDPHKALLKYNNARFVTLRLGWYGVQSGQENDQSKEEIRVLANKAQRYLSTTLNRELNLLGIDARVTDPGYVRNAKTVLNDVLEIRFALDVELLVGETFYVSVDSFEKVTFAVAEQPGGQSEEKEIAL